MKPFQFIQQLAIISPLVIMTGCVGYSALHDVSHIPLVNLHGDELKRYHQDLKLCQQQVLKQFEAKSDARNQDREFRACLINKGYVLLS